MDPSYLKRFVGGRIVIKIIIFVAEQKVILNEKN
jgi:hypothetical protein